MGGVLLKGGIFCPCRGCGLLTAAFLLQTRMQSEESPGVLRNRALDLVVSRATVLMLGWLLATAGCLGAGPEVFVEGEGAELEASMHSSFLQDFQEASDGSRMENPTGPGPVLEPWAVVGRLFQMKVPRQQVSTGDVVKVRLSCWQTRDRLTSGHMTTFNRTPEAALSRSGL